VSERKLKVIMWLCAAPFMLLVLAGIFGVEVPEALLEGAFIIGVPAALASLWVFRPRSMRVR